MDVFGEQNDCDGKHNLKLAGGEHNPDDADGNVSRGDDSLNFKGRSQRMRIATDLTEEEENFMVE